MNEEAGVPAPDDALYQETLAQLRSPRPMGFSWLLWVALGVAFVMGSFQGLRSVRGVIVLVAVVMFHELGHALGMRVFGFRDVKMFFIPFFGAAVSGRPRGAAAWKEAMVSLLGPLPGILAGLAIYFYAITRPHPAEILFHLASTLVLLNAFNLLPLGFLDGGRFLERVLFSRHRVLEVAFAALGTVILVLIAIWGRMLLLGVFAALGGLQLPHRWRLLTAASALRKQPRAFDPDPDRLSDEDARVVFDSARSAVRPPNNEKADVLAAAMESILGSLKRAPRTLATLGLLSLYGVGLIGSAVGIALIASFQGPVEPVVVKQPGWQAEFPRPPFERPPGLGSGRTWQAIVDGVERYSVTVEDSVGGRAWAQSAAARVAGEGHTTLGATKRVEIGGHEGLDGESSAPNRALRMRLVSDGFARYVVTASAPRWGERQQRFLDSFALADSRR